MEKQDEQLVLFWSNELTWKDTGVHLGKVALEEIEVPEGLPRACITYLPADKI